MKKSLWEIRLFNDLKKAYRMTISDITRYIRQSGTISVDTTKQFICWNYFKNTNPVHMYTYEEDGGNWTVISMDMLDLKLWIMENYDIDADRLDEIDESLSYLSTIGIPTP